MHVKVVLEMMGWLEAALATLILKTTCVITGQSAIRHAPG